MDLTSLPDNLTLGDIGMESILAVEMQQRIEREYEVSLTTDEIKLISVGQIKEYQNGMKYLSSYISFTQNNTLF
jgi:acyl carrier protein